MAAPTDPTPEVLGARRYSARVRIAIAVTGGLLLAVDSALADAPLAAAIGFAVIGATGVVELFVRDERWLAIEEALSCVAVMEDRHIEGFYRRRLRLTPGMTGPWQVAGSARIPMREMKSIDYLYVADWSLWGDVKIMLRTIPVVLLRRGQ